MISKKRKKPTLRERIGNFFKKKSTIEAEEETAKKLEEEAAAKKVEEEKVKEEQEEKTQREDFISYLKDVADKGLDGIEEERKTGAAKVLLENKQKANGEVDMKSFKTLESKANKDGGR